MNFKSTTEQGDALRDEVRDLLKAAHKPNYGTEVPVTGKNVDVYYEESLGFETIKIVVECKSDDGNLGYTKVSEIVTDYSPMLMNGEIDRVHIISFSGLTPNAKKHLESFPKINHLTYDQFKSSLMNFSTYRSSLIAQYGNDGLEKYYIKPLLSVDEKEFDAETYINEWVDSDDCQPVAVLAGYGMGKTSLSRRLAYNFAKVSSAGKSSRIPILIRLGDIAKEQDLEGLISKNLAAFNAVTGYHFDLFLALNRTGAFVIILDGFDEMKHMMTINEFKLNIEELNRLVDMNSKVVLLGRPSAFMSDDERISVLHGIDKYSDSEVRNLKFNDFKEVYLNEFSEDQVVEFVKGYLKYFQEKENSVGNLSITDDFIDKRTSELSSGVYRELTARPVHVEMLASISASPDMEMHNFTRFELYSIFIKQIYDREYKKSERRHIDVDRRKKFISNIAWYFWKSNQSAGFLLSEIPTGIVRSIVMDTVEPTNNILRDLVVGSVIEPKGGNKFYFKHRSFQEFLVAEHVCDTSLNKGEISTFSNTINDEIVAFIKESKKTDRLIELYTALHEFKGTLCLRYLGLISWYMENYYDEEPVLKDDSPWIFVIKYLRKFVNEDDNDPLSEVSFIKSTFSNVTLEETQLMCLLLLIIESHATASSSEKLVLQSVMASLVVFGSLPEIERIVNRSKKEKKIAMNMSRNSACMEIMLKTFKSHRVGSDTQIDITMKDVYKIISDKISPSWVLDDFMQLSTDTILSTKVDLLGDHISELKMTDKGATCVKYFNDYHSAGRIVPVTKALGSSKLSPQ